jgi:hypothetical protein
MYWMFLPRPDRDPAFDVSVATITFVPSEAFFLEGQILFRYLIVIGTMTCSSVTSEIGAIVKRKTLGKVASK